MPRIHLIQPRFTYKGYEPFTENKERIKKLKETLDLSNIYQKERNNFFSQHDMAYGSFKYLHRRAVSEKFLCDKPFNIARNPKYGEYQRDIVSMLYNFFDRIFCYWYGNTHYITPITQILKSNNKERNYTS